MPKLEPKQIQQELKDGQLWPVYWLYGTERMKSRELLKRIRKTVLGDADEGKVSGAALFASQFAEEHLDATEVDSGTVLDAAQSMSLGGSLRLIVVKDAHALKEPELLAELLGPRAKRDQLQSVCVFLSKDLDGRKKFSKILLEKAAVVPCEEVPEADREAWIGYLAKGRGLSLSLELAARLRSLDPWNLDIVDQELQKYQLALEVDGDPTLASEVVLGGAGGSGGAEAFLDAFLNRNYAESFRLAESFARRPDESLPLLGLLGWNVRHLALVVVKSPGLKLNSFLEDRLRRWGSHWRVEEILALQSRLAELDFQLKQTPRLPLGMWAELVTQFCHKPGFAN